MIRKLAVLLFAVQALSAAEASFDGIKVHYLSFGKGDEAVVFIHGWTCDLTFWKGQAPVYEARRSLLIDLPGHGASGKPEVSYTMDLFAKAVDAVMTDAGVRKATLAGHSMGTPVAIQFLRAHPEKVTGLVIVDGFVPQPPKNGPQFNGAVKALSAPDYKSFAGRMIDSMFTPKTEPALKEQIKSKMLSAPQYVMLSAMEGMGSMTPVSESYPKLRTVALMMKRPNGAPYREYLNQHFLLVDFKEFDGAGHFLMMEQPAKFNQALLEFLDGKQ